MTVKGDDVVKAMDLDTGLILGYDDIRDFCRGILMIYVSNSSLIHTLKRLVRL